MSIDRTDRTKRYVVFGVLFWFVSALVAGWFGLLSVPGQPPILLGLFIVIPILFAGALYIFSAQFRSYLNGMPLWLIVGAHVWRYVGLGFLIACFLGRLPAEFAIPEGLGDIAAALFALPLARALWYSEPVRGYFVAWNVFGLVDLLSAITVGILYSQGPMGILRTGVSTELMITFPVNVIPTFFVPLFILLHVLAFLRRNEVRAQDNSIREAAGATSVR